MRVAYYSSTSLNTFRLAAKLAPEHALLRIGLGEPTFSTFDQEPFVVMVPSYQDVPEPVKEFLGRVDLKNLRGFIGVGNRNFGPGFCWVTRHLSALYGVPSLYEVELMGTPEDIDDINNILNQLDREENE